MKLNEAFISTLCVLENNILKLCAESLNFLETKFSKKCTLIFVLNDSSIFSEILSGQNIVCCILINYSTTWNDDLLIKVLLLIFPLGNTKFEFGVVFSVYHFTANEKCSLPISMKNFNYHSVMTKCRAYGRANFQRNFFFFRSMTDVCNKGSLGALYVLIILPIIMNRYLYVLGAHSNRQLIIQLYHVTVCSSFWSIENLCLICAIDSS